MSQNETIQLVPIAITGLSLQYARRMEGNKFKHYTLPYVSLILKDKTPQQRVIEYVQEENPGANVVILDAKRIPLEVGGSIHSPLDLSKEVLSSSKTRKAYNQFASKSQIHQYVHYDSFLDKVVAHTVSKLNSFISLFIGVNPYNGRPKEIVKYPKNYYKRVTCCRFLCYLYDEDQEQQAIDKLKKDLDLLADKDLLMGHLAKPSAIYMADTVGSLVLRKAIFAFIFVDDQKLCKLLDCEMLSLPKDALKRLGIDSETPEGGIGPSLEGMRQYEIEEVMVGVMPSEEARQAHVDSYLESREAVNQIAKAANDSHSQYNVEKESVILPRSHDENGKPLNQIAVNINITKKN